MSEPQVSIVIPVYNGANYLREAINSALGQSYSNIEIIVVNDGSADDGQTEAIILSYGDLIHYFTKENGGVASALNLGIENMRGEWFVWLSHDDLFSADRIASDMELLLSIPDAKISFCMSVHIDSFGNILKMSSYPITHVANLYDVMTLDGMHMGSMTINRECFSRVGKFNENNLTNQDVEMTLRLAKHYHFYHNQVGVVYIRDHRERGTYTQAKQRRPDLRNLATYLHENMSFEDFFPKVDPASVSSFRSWVWLGNFYTFLGATNYTDECYCKAILTQKTQLGKIRQLLRLVLLRGPSIARHQPARFSTWLGKMLRCALSRHLPSCDNMSQK